MLKPVCDLLYAYIVTIHKGLRMNAAEEYGAFKKYLEEEHQREAGLLKESKVKLKGLCEMFPDQLRWDADPLAPGLGYIVAQDAAPPTSCNPNSNSNSDPILNLTLAFR